MSCKDLSYFWDLNVEGTSFQLEKIKHIFSLKLNMVIGALKTRDFTFKFFGNTDVEKP